MFFIYLIIIFFIIGILAFTFWKILKKNKFELNYKENYILLAIFILLIISIDYFYNQIFIIITILFLFLILYYIIRTIKLKKYVPLKIIIFNILIYIISIISYLFIAYIRNDSGFDALGVAVVLYIKIMIYFILSCLLLIINIILSIIKSVKKSRRKYKNSKYKINYAIIIIYLFILIITAAIALGVKIHKNNRMKSQKEKVIIYLNKKYPEYDFKIISSTVSCYPTSSFECNDDFYDNEVLEKSTNIKFYVEVDFDTLGIISNEFEDIVKKIK